MPTTLFANGTIVSATGRQPGDVLVDDETIVAILAPGQAESMGVNADRTIDATDKYVIPGGIDAHTHMELPFGGTFRQRHVRDRHDRCRLGRDHHDRRLRCPADR